MGEICSLLLTLLKSDHMLHVILFEIAARPLFFFWGGETMEFQSLFINISLFSFVKVRV